MDNDPDPTESAERSRPMPLDAGPAREGPPPASLAMGLGPAAARAIGLFLGGAAAGLALNAVRPQRIALRAYEAPVACTGEGVAHATNGGEGAPDANAIELLRPQRAAALCGRADAVVLDTRSAARFAEGHVAGAVHLPCDASGGMADSALLHVDQARTFVVYGEDDEDAQPVARSLRSRLPSSRRVVVLEGGFAAWERANLSCASGPCDECSASLTSAGPVGAASSQTPLPSSLSGLARPSVATAPGAAAAGASSSVDRSKPQRGAPLRPSRGEP